MRGPQPDAECPRCNHRQPPSGALVTCLACGLSYPPKELQHRASKSSRPPSALVVVQPTDLAIDTDGDAVTFRWTDNGIAAPAAIGASVILAALVWTSTLPLGQILGYTGFLIFLVVYGVHLSRRRPRVHLDRNRLRGTAETLLLADITRIDVDGGRITAITRYGKSHEIATSKDPNIAAYVGDEIAKRIGQTD